MNGDSRVKKRLFKKEFLPIPVALTTILLFILMERFGYRSLPFPWEIFPSSWLLRNFILGPIAIIVFFWSGWILLIPLLVGLCCSRGQLFYVESLSLFG